MCSTAWQIQLLSQVAEAENKNLFSEDSEDEDLYKPQSWKEIVVDKPEFKTKIHEDVAKDFDTAPPEFRNFVENVSPKVKKRREERRKKIECQFCQSLYFD